MLKPLLRWISRTDYARSAIEDQADLAVFREKPTPRIIWGLIIIGVSYIIGWPAVAALGLLATYLKEPLILIIGGPVTYGLSHLVFILGAYLAGTFYAKHFFRWAVRMAIEKHLGPTPATAPDRTADPATTARPNEPTVPPWAEDSFKH